jgi:hypothetical protein
MSPTDPRPAPQAALLLSAVRRLLRPLVRLLMRSGVTFPVFADLLRGLFVEIAANELLEDDKSRTDSRISLLSGVHRKEIRRLRSLPSEAWEAPRVVSLGGEVIARWVGTPDYKGQNGEPMPLPRSGDGGGPTFDSLVASVTTDIRPRAVLDDLIGQGIVFMDGTDNVRLNALAFVPRPGGEEQLYYFTRNLHDHIAAASANIQAAEQAPFLDRSVHYDLLTGEQAGTLRDYARDAAMRALLDVNQRALELTGGQQESRPGRWSRVNFGVYVFGEAERPGQNDPG